MTIEKVKREVVFVKVLKEIEPESGIIIKAGAFGILRLKPTPTGWPVFQTQECGNEWDLAFEVNELKDYFEVITR